MNSRWMLWIPVLFLAMSSCTDSPERGLTGPDTAPGTVSVSVTSSDSSVFEITVSLSGPPSFRRREAHMRIGETSTFDDLEPGAYLVSTTIFGYDCLPVSVVVQPRQTTAAGIACIHRATSAITGTITGTVTSGDSPIGGASVELSAPGVSMTRLTALNGQLSFVGVQGGEYHLTVSHKHFHCPGQTLQIVPDRTTTVDIECSPKSTGTITGIVTPSGVQVEVVQLTGPAARSTTADHRNSSFAFDDLPPGAYTVTATASGGTCDPVRADVQAARDTPVVITCAFRSPPSGPSGPLPAEIAGAWGYHRTLVSQTGSCPSPLPQPGTGSMAFGSGTRTMTALGLDPELPFVGPYEESGAYAASGSTTLGDGSTIRSHANLSFYWDMWDVGGLVFVGSFTRKHGAPGGTLVCTEVYDVWGWRN